MALYCAAKCLGALNLIEFMFSWSEPSVAAVTVVIDVRETLPLFSSVKSSTNENVETPSASSPLHTI